jgi:galactokinase
MLGLPSLRDATLDDVQRLPDVLRQRARHVVTENHRVEQAVACLDAADVVGLAPLMLESHASLRDDFAVSVAELDTAVAAVMDAGAVGARMTGGGFGGSVLALVPQDLHDIVARAVRRAFAVAGLGEPQVFPVQVSGGARRVEVGDAPPRIRLRTPGDHDTP